MGYCMRDKDTGEVLMEHVAFADCFWRRFLGLMGKPHLPGGDGLLLRKVGSVHTCFMRFPMVAVYLDRDYRVIAKEVLVPWRCGRIYKKASHVLEVGIDDGDKFHADMKLYVENLD